MSTQAESILTKIRISLLETQIFNNIDKQEIYLETFQRLVIELRSKESKEESEKNEEIAKYIEDFIKTQRDFFVSIKDGK